MPIRGKIVAIALSSAAILGLMSLKASARIVCNEDGDCWHVQEDFAYPPDAHVVIHPDDWRWGADQHFAWKEHTGHGYWEHNQWRGF